MTATLSVLYGLTLGTALVLALAGLTGTRLRPTRTTTAPRSRLWPKQGTLLRVAAALAAGAAAWAATGWPVAGAAVAAGVLGIPPLVNPSRPREVIALGEALASWTRRLADLLSSGSGGLQQAIATSAATAPEPLREPVTRMAARVRGEGLEPAVRAFAAELADPAVDEVAMTLILRSRTGGRGLAEILQDQATSLAGEVTARREVEADRATSRTTVRALVGITVAMISGLVLFARDYLAPFDTLTGQAALAAVVLVMAVALVWMHRLARPSRSTRYLTVTTGGGNVG